MIPEQGSGSFGKRTMKPHKVRCRQGAWHADRVPHNSRSCIHRLQGKEDPPDLCNAGLLATIQSVPGLERL